MATKEKFKEAKRLYETANADQRYVLESLFPELKESEDERIRKEIISAIKEDWPGHTDWIAWIEKQAQKQNANCLLSWSEIDEKMLQSLEGIVKDYWAKAEQEKNEIKIREASNVSYFLKTIQKSPLCWIKCSDGLPNRDGTYLVVTDGKHNDVYDMARYDPIEGWHKASEIICWMPIPQLNNKSIIEQKPVWSEEDKNMLEWVIEYLNNKMLNTPISEERTACKNAIAWLEEKLKGHQTSTDKVKPKFKVGDKIYLKPEYRMPDDDTPIANTVKEIIRIDDKYYRFDGSYIFIEDQDKYELVEQKPWSEKDEDMLKMVIKLCEQCGNEYAYYWLKSIKDRVQPQPKQEWSKEDERKLNAICSLVYSNPAQDPSYAKISLEKWLKSLRPQSHWEPSERQKEALLWCVVHLGGANKQTLGELLEELNKL